MDEKQESVVLGYTVHKFSSYSANYIPDNIMVNNPEDQLSRWFTDSSTQSQYIMLKLKSPNIVETIKFGKFVKAHVSNLKKFQVLGGTEENNLSLLLSAGLKNDNTPEVFRLRHKTQEGLYLPIVYLKIVPLQSWGPAYNYTIWYVELMGKDQDRFVSSALETINLRKEEEAIRLLLKHLRRRRYKDAFEALSRESGVKLEGAVQARLWNTLVENGDYKMAEKIFQEAANEGELEWYLSWQPYTPVWRQMSPCSPQVEALLEDSPDACLGYSIGGAAYRANDSFPEVRPGAAPRPDAEQRPGAERRPVPDLNPAPQQLQDGQPAPAPDVSEPSTGYGRANDSFPEVRPGAAPRPDAEQRPGAERRPVPDLNPAPQQLQDGQPAPAPDVSEPSTGYGRNNPMNGTFLCGGTTVEQTEEACCSAGNCGKPGPRGGHQLVVDSTTGTLYLYGGWNGRADLDDLWAYSTTEEQWKLLCQHSAAEGGPSPRSCHKMVFDPTQRRLYTLGRYLDSAQRVPSNMNGDMYSYDVPTSSWSLVCDDTGAAGGPRLVFDHQMCIDADTQTIYVFGGRVLPNNCSSEESVTPQYSGLYAYYIRTDTWQLLLPDKHSLPAPQPRVSHSMLFHPVARKLFIFAGQRNKEHLVDLWWWDVSTQECGALCCAAATSPPQAGFTQRATLDPDADEMYVLSGMGKEKERGVYNKLWVFSFRWRMWSCAYRNETCAPQEPRPRFAHQLVFDANTKTHYLFGGNPGKENRPRLRLDDLWSLRLIRPTPIQVLVQVKATIREAAYRALCASPTKQIAALDYLRNELNEVTDHSDPLQVARFQKLATLLFSGCGWCAGSARVPLTPQRARTLARRRAALTSSYDLAHALSVVLGADESTLQPSQPFEETIAPEPETWDVGRDEDSASPSAEWLARESRMQLYEELARYFRPSTVPPAGDVMDIVTL